MTDLTHCPISGGALDPIVNLGLQPIFMGTTSSEACEDKLSQMTWGATKDGIVHLISRVPLDILYSKSHNSGLIGGIWERHHREFANFIANYKPQQIAEIGGGHGILSKEYAKLRNFQKWTIYEPNPSGSLDPRVKIRSELFREGVDLGQCECIVHSHLFEHLYDHNSILSAIHGSLIDDGLMIFSVPNMPKMLEGGYVNALNFEHVTYLPEDLIEYLLKKNGFKILNQKYFLEDHSIFYACRKTKNKVREEYRNKSNIKYVKNFFFSELNKITELNKTINEKYKTSQVFLFGAHIFSQFYLVNGLKGSLIKGVLDNDPNKQDQRLYGTNLTVRAPTCIAAIDNPVVIVRVGAYKDEIIHQLRTINPSVNIIL